MDPETKRSKIEPDLGLVPDESFLKWMGERMFEEMMVEKARDNQKALQIQASRRGERAKSHKEVV